MLNGCSCSGKSTIVKNIMAQKERYYQLSYDSLKWSFSQYRPDVHFDDVRALVRAVAESVCGMNYNIVCDSALYRDAREELLQIPKKHGYEVIEINLEADYEVLEERFDSRVKDAILNPEKRISNTSKDRFKELYDIYNAEKNPLALTLRTDRETVELITEKIVTLA